MEIRLIHTYYQYLIRYAVWKKKLYCFSKWDITKIQKLSISTAFILRPKCLPEGLSQHIYIFVLIFENTFQSQFVFMNRQNKR